MKKLFKTAGIILFLVLLSYIFLIYHGKIGTGKSFIENTARKAQKIDKTWQVAKDTNRNLSAMVFYPEDKSDCTFSIYVKHSGLSFGYFFYRGGSCNVINDSVAKVVIEGIEEYALISMNKQKISKIKIENAGGNQIISLNKEEPFAIVIPAGNGQVTIYDEKNSIVENILYQI